MKTGVVTLLGLFCTAFGTETVAGRGGLVKSYFEVIKTVNETMVYYLKRLQDNRSDNACIVVSEELAHYGLSTRYPNAKILPRENVYDLIQNKQTTTLKVCEGVGRPVNFEHNIISITPNVCQFSAIFCDIQGETVFWNTSTNFEVIARGQADIWILGRQPLMKLLVFEEVNGIFILQLLRKVKIDRNEELWVTNVNGLLAKEILANSTADNFSHLGQYLTHSDFLNINGMDAEGSVITDGKTDNDSRSEGEIKSGDENTKNSGDVSGVEVEASRILSMEQMVLYTFILVVILVAFHFLERIFGLIINCILLSKTRNHGCGALCFNSLSQNMMNNHLQRYYTNKVSVSKTSGGAYGVNEESENRKLSNDMLSMNVYEETNSGYFE